VSDGDFQKAQLRARRVGDIAWADNNSTIGNAAINLETALRQANTVPAGVHEDLFTYLLAELDVVLKPLREKQQPQRGPRRMSAIILSEDLTKR
jgi:hypothetical protein